jgi:hypothetical protein
MSIKLSIPTVVALVLVCCGATFLITKSIFIESHNLTAIPNNNLESESTSLNGNFANNKAALQSNIAQVSGTQAIENEILNATSYWADKSFTTSNSVTSIFVDGDGAIVEKSLSAALTGDSFSDFIEKVKEADETQFSIERELQLMETFNQLRTSDVHAEEYSCRGKVCAVSFLHNEDSRFDVDKLGLFGENFSFSNTEVTDTGAYKTKLLYIHTDDALTMSMTRG